MTVHITECWRQSHSADTASSPYPSSQSVGSAGPVASPGRPAGRHDAAASRPSGKSGVMARASTSPGLRTTSASHPDFHAPAPYCLLPLAQARGVRQLSQVHRTCSRVPRRRLTPRLRGNDKRAGTWGDDYNLSPPSIAVVRSARCDRDVTLNQVHTSPTRQGEGVAKIAKQRSSAGAHRSWPPLPVVGPSACG